MDVQELDPKNLKPIASTSTKIYLWDDDPRNLQAALLWELVGSGWGGWGGGWSWSGGSTGCTRSTTSLGTSTDQFAHCTEVVHYRNHHNNHHSNGYKTISSDQTAIDKLMHHPKVGFGDYFWKVPLFWLNFFTPLVEFLLVLFSFSDNRHPDLYRASLKKVCFVEICT